jgi:hypothetical protein
MPKGTRELIGSLAEITLKSSRDSLPIRTRLGRLIGSAETPSRFAATAARRRREKL